MPIDGNDPKEMEMAKKSAKAGNEAKVEAKTDTQTDTKADGKKGKAGADEPGEGLTAKDYDR